MSIRKITYSGLIIALAILLPQVLHLIAGAQAGKMLLPMHMPVLLGGFVLGPFFGLAIGILSPIVSTFTTGMPAIDKLVFTILELASYGFVSGLFYNTLKFRKRKLAGIYTSLFFSMIAGRIVYAISLFVAAELLGIPCGGATAAVTATVSGIYGIVLQILIIPSLVLVLEKSGFLDKYIGTGGTA